MPATTTWAWRFRASEAVNNWGKLGAWVFHVCRNPQLLDKEMKYLAQASGNCLA